MRAVLLRARPIWQALLPATEDVLVELAIALNHHVERQLLRGNLGKRNIDSRKQAALERCQVRREHDTARQAKNLFDFGRMAMLAYTVGLNALVGTAVMRAGVG